MSNPILASQHPFAFLQENRHHVIKTKEATSSEFLMSNTLVLPNVTMEDRGQYRCRAELEPQTYTNTETKVLIFGGYPAVAVDLRFFTNQ